MAGLVVTPACAIDVIAVFVADDIWRTHTLDNRGYLIVTWGPPFFLAGFKIVGGIDASRPVGLCPVSRIINPISPARTVAGITDIGLGQIVSAVSVAVRPGLEVGKPVCIMTDVAGKMRPTCVIGVVFRVGGMALGGAAAVIISILAAAIITTPPPP